MLDILEQAARESGEVLRSFFQKELVIQEKTSQHDIVTEADVAAQNIIKEALLAGALKHGLKESEIGFIGEEKGVNKLAKHTFIIDPLDGTNNFASGLDIFGVTIAYMRDREVQAGVIYLPVKNELYTAEKGRGAYLVGQTGRTRLHMKPVNLSSTLLAGNMTADHARRQVLIRAREKLNSLFRSVRFLQCVTVDVACVTRNIFGAFLAWGPHLWDVAAGKLIIEEAGGVMTDWEGKELQFNLSDFDHVYKLLAAHPDNLPVLLEALKKV